MKHPFSFAIGLAVLARISLVSSVSAVVSIDYVSVGNAGNAADTTGFGAVGYDYKIAKNETTIGQYCEFLNAKAKSDPYGLYDSGMASVTTIAGISRSGSSGNYVYVPVPGTEYKPITYVGWFDAARFCNWIQNGQGSGSTETGAYTLNGAMTGIYTVNAGATTWIPSANEWYKAAYYDATKGGTGGYWKYATQSNTLAGNTIGVPHSANYNDGNFVGYPGMALTDVGAYGANSCSFYGTNDQGGNVWELTDADELRGGSWYGGEGSLLSSYRYGLGPLYGFYIGFRVASVPEPSCLVLTLLASGVLVTRRKR